MTPEKLKEIEATAQEAFKNGTYNDKMYDWLQENRRVGYITGALSRQPELDTLESENTRLRERVRELEGKLSLFTGNFSSYMPKKGMTDDRHIASVWHSFQQSKSLLAKPADSTGGGEKEVCKCPLFLDASYGKCLTCGLDLV